MYHRSIKVLLLKKPLDHRMNVFQWQVTAIEGYGKLDT